MKWIGMLGVLGCLLMAQPAAADGPSHRKAVEELMQAVQVETVFKKSIDQMLEVQLEANPGMAPFAPVFKKFFVKYMGWETLKEDFIKLYMQEFSEKEIREITAFYRTKTGKKAAVRLPVLMSKGAEIGQQRVQEHMPELMQMLREAAEKQGAPAK